MAVVAARYSDEELEEFKELIEEKIIKTKQEVDFLKSQITESHENSSSQHSGDWTDESSLHTEMEFISNSLLRQQQFLRNLELAHMRVQNKTYGICSITGQLIDKGRLRLVPHATKSVEAKNARPVIATSPNHAASENGSRLMDEEMSIKPEERVQMQKEYFENI